MPIDLTQLAAAGLAASTNVTLTGLYGRIIQYNALVVGPGNPAAQRQAIRLLDKIMKQAAVYLTSKPPQQGKATNLQRWNALTDLARQAATEAQTLGVKLLTSPADFRQIRGDPNLMSQSYWLERVDPRHRAGFQLSAKYEQWIAGGSAAHGKNSFWDFADAGGAMMQVLFLGEGDVDGDGFPIRECYRIQLDAAGIATGSDGAPISTRGMETAHSGAGWAVFVVDPNGALYARAHEVGYFHHSTFLAGRPVAAAGELLIDDTGRIRIITAKTGHYRAGVVEMERMATLIPTLPGDAMVLPDFTKMAPVARGGLNQALLYRLSDFRARGTAAPICTRSEVTAHFPGFGNASASVMAMINKVPAARPLNPSAPAFAPRGRPMDPNAPPFVPRA
jgi:hypothetical protein